MRKILKLLSLKTTILKSLKVKQLYSKLSLHEIKRKNLPELDDEFAKDVSEFDTLEEYKARYQNTSAERKEKDAATLAKETAVVDKAAANRRS